MKETATKLKKQLKEKLPEYTFSVTSDYNSITIAVMSGPAEFPAHEQLNHYSFKSESCRRERYEEKYHRVFDVVENLLEGLEKNEITSVDADYGSIPNYYKHYNIGKWDKAYKCTEVKPTAEEMMDDFNYVGSRHHY